DAHDQRDAGVGGLHDRVGGEGRRHEDHAGVGAGLPGRLADGVKHRDAAEHGLPALARRDAADDLGAVGERLLGVEEADLAGDALDDEAGVLVDEDAHDLTISTILVAASRRLVAVVIDRPLSSSSFLPSSTLVPSRRTTRGTLRPTSLTAA